MLFGMIWMFLQHQDAFMLIVDSNTSTGQTLFDNWMLVGLILSAEGYISSQMHFKKNVRIWIYLHSVNPSTSWHHRIWNKLSSCLFLLCLNWTQVTRTNIFQNESLNESIFLIYDMQKKFFMILCKVGFVTGLYGWKLKLPNRLQWVSNTEF
jgi:hypothetical protein